MKTPPEITTIATLPDGSTIERHTGARLVKWFAVRNGKKVLLEKAPRWELLKFIESFVLRRFAVGAEIHPG